MSNLVNNPFEEKEIKTESKNILSFKDLYLNTQTNHCFKMITSRSSTGLPYCTVDLGTVILSPTGNCQIASYSKFENLLSKNFENEIDVLNVILTLSTTKNLLLIDIRASFEKRATSIFGEENVYIRTPYTSTYDGGNMIMILYKTSRLKDERRNRIKEYPNYYHDKHLEVYKFNHSAEHKKQTVNTMLYNRQLQIIDNKIEIVGI